MIRLLSFFYPITRKVKSDYNGTIEITWYRGKKQLNSKNANYSYGSLQKILKIGLQKIDLSQCKNILLLEFGGGSVIKTLRDNFNYDNNIIAIDIDPVIISIAQDEFNITNDEKITVLCADAFEFMKNNSLKFDLVIVDLFVDTEIPESFYTRTFWQHIIKATTNKGSILFNASLHSSDDKKLSDVSTLLHKNKFQLQKLKNVNKTNTLLIATSTM